MDERTERHAASEQAFELAGFFPYRLAVLADCVSQAVAQVYAERFQLTRAEWRVMAALGAMRAMAASEIGPYSTLDKMQVSRAVARLEKVGLVVRRPDPKDLRARILSLTSKGSALLGKIVPLVQARERHLLETLTPAERSALESAMKALFERAGALVSRG